MDKDNAEKRPEQQTDEDIITECKEFCAKADENDEHNRRAWLEDMRFARLGDQWPEQVRRQREIDGRPCLTINKMPAFIRQVTNDARQNKPSLRYRPVSDGANQETAEIIEGLTRSIENTSAADIAYDTAIDHAVSAGFGYIKLNIDYAHNDTFDLDICIERVINPLTVYKDYAATSADGSDWMRCAEVVYYTKDEFKQKWPDADLETNFPAPGIKVDPTWFDQDRVRVAAWWVRREVQRQIVQLSNGNIMFADEMAKTVSLPTGPDGQPQEVSFAQLVENDVLQVVQRRMTPSYEVKQYILTGAAILERHDWAGQYIPIVPVYGEEVMIDGKVYYLSLIRHARDSQQMFNYWRTASTELVALAPKAPYIGPSGAFNTDADKWATVNTVNYGYIEYDGSVPPQRQEFAGPPAGALQEAMNASDDMKAVMGLFDASLGKQSNETSGIAITARQKQGDISTFHFIDNLSRSLRHLGRIVLDLIPHVYNDQRIIRVLGEDGNTQPITINTPTTTQASANPLDGKQGGMPVLYDLTVGKYDVVCDSGPSYETKRQEASEGMLRFVQAFPEAAPLIGDLIAKNQDWAESEKIAQRLAAMLPPQILGQNPQLQALQQQMQQMQQQAQQAIQTLQAQLQQKDQENRALRADKQIDLYSAQTERMRAETERYEAQQVPKGVQDQMGERERELLDIAGDMAVQEKKNQGAVAVELLKQQGAAAAAQVQSETQQIFPNPQFPM